MLSLLLKDCNIMNASLLKFYKQSANKVKAKNFYWLNSNKKLLLKYILELFLHENLEQKQTHICTQT